MLKNYFKTAWRNMMNNKFYSALTIIGLSVGLAVSGLILLWVDDELAFDQFNHKAVQIYRVNTALGTGNSKGVYSVTPGSVAAYGLKEVPGVLAAVRWDNNNDYSVISYRDKIFQGNQLIYTDASVFTLFDFKMLTGSRTNPFPTYQSVVITASTAKKYFGKTDAVGEILLGDHKDNFTVSGVIEDFPENSSLKGDILFSTDLVKQQVYAAGKSIWKSLDDDWGNYRWNTYLLLQSGTAIQSVGDKLTGILVKHNPDQRPADLGSFQLQPLTKTHLYAADGSSAGMDMVKIFAMVAVLILLIASINYVNLSTARAILRAKEVTLRKIIGAARKQLIGQFIAEAMVFFFIALLLAIVAMSLLMPLYNSIAGKRMHFDPSSLNLWKVIGTTFIVTLSAASIYPALLLSSFKPIQSLKGKLSIGVGNTIFRRVLVVSQFVFSIGLIIGTLVINGQLNFIRKKELGYDKSNVFSIPLHDMQEHYDAVKAHLLRQPGILDITTAGRSIINVPGATLDVEWDGKDPNMSYFIHSVGVDHNFMSFFKIPFTSGAGFTGSKMDSTHFVLNETAVQEAGIKNPVGKKLRLGRTTGTIIGVVKDFHFASLKQKIQPFVFYYQPENERMFIKTTGEDAPFAIYAAENIYKQYNPAFPFDYSFMDDSYDKMYKSDQRTGLLFNIFAIIAIVISCLGLFGLATYTAQVRVKEIGIRKVLGASAAGIATMLSKDFLSLVMLSILIATPIAWWAMNKWLMDFAYHTSVSWWIFAATGFGAFGISLLTVSYQAIKAAIANPVRSLRNE
jgi:putative ABC transport system permease protein